MLASDRLPKLGEIIQHGYVVDDIGRYVEKWVETVGVGPFYVSDVTLDDYFFQGERRSCDLRIAVGYWGSLQIELIQPLGSADNLYTRAVAAESGRLNHCASVVPDLDLAVDTCGLGGRVLQSGCVASGARFVYLEHYLPGGCHLELIQFPAGTGETMSRLAAMARRWDGTEPLRPASALPRDLAQFAALA